MKTKVKALQGKICRINYKINGYDHSICGVIEKLNKTRFILNGEKEVHIRYENVTKIELIKS